MFTNADIMRIAMEQSAADINCQPEDFLKRENVIVPSVIGERARAYYNEPVTCNLVSYGSNIVASVKPGYEDIVRDYMEKFEFYHCFETPNMHVLDEKMAQLGQRICFMAEYFLPDISKVQVRECGFETRVLGQEDFGELYAPEWSNALCEKRRQLDVLGVGAYDRGELIGLAGCSADCEDMWQIGIDVLPEYRRRGIAAALTGRLAAEALRRGKVPFYCCAWSNIPSARNAVRSGFLPAWAELTVKPENVVRELNGV